MRRMLLLASLVVSSTPALGIVIRHDAADAEYRELGVPHRAVVDMDGATGTLVAPRWLLTAAHTAIGLGPLSPPLRINGERYRIDRVVLHPAYVSHGRRSRRDLALVRLDRDVDGLAPVPVASCCDEPGRRVTFVGAGRTGTGLTGPTQRGGERRAAHNLIDEVTEESLVFDFDAPPSGEPLEGISGPGDSGGPALIERDGRFEIVGVSSANSGEGDAHSTYGTREVYARVTTARDWIADVLADGAAWWSGGWQTPVPATDEAWRQSAESETVGAFFTAFNSGDADVFEAYLQRVQSPDSADTRSPAQRKTSYGWLIDEHGTFEPKRITRSTTGRIQVLVHAPGSGLWQVLNFELDPATGKLKRWTATDVPPPRSGSASP